MQQLGHAGVEERLELGSDVVTRERSDPALKDVRKRAGVVVDEDEARAGEHGGGMVVQLASLYDDLVDFEVLRGVPDVGHPVGTDHSVQDEPLIHVGHLLLLPEGCQIEDHVEESVARSRVCGEGEVGDVGVEPLVENSLPSRADALRCTSPDEGLACALVAKHMQDPADLKRCLERVDLAKCGCGHLLLSIPRLSAKVIDQLWKLNQLGVGEDLSVNSEQQIKVFVVHKRSHCSKNRLFDHLFFISYRRL
eukprot:745686-Hanusia_phi.AAC.5